MLAAGSPGARHFQGVYLTGRSGRCLWSSGRPSALSTIGPNNSYKGKPFKYGELRARINAVLRRREARREGPTRVGDLVIDPVRRRVTVGERVVPLSKKEFALLHALAVNPTRVFTKEELLDSVWAYKGNSKTRTLDSHASRLRRKLDPDKGRFVINCWGYGYRLIDG